MKPSTDCRLLSAHVCILVALAVFAPGAAAAEQKHVLVFFGQWRTLPVNAFVEQKLHTELDPKGTGDVQFYAESLDEERLTDRGHLENVALALQRKYSGRKFDLVFATMPSTVRFLAEYGSGIFGTVPVVFSVVNQGSLENKLPANFTGTTTELNAGTTLKIMLRLHPRTRRVVVIAGTSNLAQEWLAEARSEFGTVADRVAVDVLTVGSMGELVRTVSTLPSDVLIYFVFAMRTSDGRFLAPRAVLASFAGAASVPVYVSDDRLVGNGAVGGFVMDNEASVNSSVAMAASLLSGSRVADLPVRTVQNRFLFDARQLDRWGVDEGLLPAGSEVRYRTPSVWQAHKGTIAAVAVFVFVESALLLVLVIERRRKAALQRYVAQQFEQMRSLSAKLITAHEEERRRIARDLHDDVKQRVALIGLGLSGLKRSSGSRDVEERITDLSRSANELALSLGQIAKGLHPAALEHTSLDSALRSLGRECAERTGITILTHTDPIPADVSAAVKLCFFRVAQEALQNVVKHSGATVVTIDLRWHKGSIHLSIVDNGRGFEMKDAQLPTGLGLLSMRERLRTANGSLEIRGARGSGTSVLASAPAGFHSAQSESRNGERQGATASQV
jgi:signal transduction histidine kinase